MSARQGFLLIAGFSGLIATLVFYLFLLFVQIQNADNACESPQAVPGIDVESICGIGFENGYLNLGGNCTYCMNDGSTVHTREPGWRFSGTMAGFAAVIACAVAFFARRKGHVGVLFGLTTFLAPPLGLLLAIAVPRRASSQGPAAL